MPPPSTAIWPAALAILALACSGRVVDTTRAPPGPDRVVRDGVVFTPDVRVEGPADHPVLVARVRLRNLAETAVTLDSDVGNCEPALRFAGVAGGRRFEWSHLGWQVSQHGDRLACVGTGLLVSIPPRREGELGRQTYPVRTLRGDSIPAGRYAVGVPAIVLTWPGGFLHADTLYVWARDVILP